MEVDGSYLVARTLKEEGVEQLFFLMGGPNYEIINNSADFGIKVTDFRHEQAASMAAHAYARVTGKPGVCTLITGPGVTNATTGIGQAFADSIPMLIISSANDSQSLGKGWGRLHESTELCAITRPITAFSVMVHDPSEVPGYLAKAFALFSAQRPRPVHIAIPIDVMEMMVNEDWSPQVVPNLPMPSGVSFSDATALLASSQQTVMIVGGGCQRASTEVTKLAELLNVGVIASNAGKGVISDENPLSLGGGIISPAIHDYLA